MKRIFMLLIALIVAISLSSVAQEDAEPVIFAESAGLQGVINGIYFDNDNHLVVTSILTSFIKVIDAETGDVLATYNFDDDVYNPDDVFVTADNEILYTNLLGGEIGMIAPDGTRTTVAQLPPGTNPITMTDDGRLFTALCFLGDDVYEVDIATGESTLLVEDVGGCGMNGMDIGPDGALYGPLWFGGAIARVDIDTGEMSIVAKDLAVPAALKFDSEGRLHVIDTLVGEVLQIDLSTGEHTLVATLEPGLDNLAFDMDDRLYVSSFVTGSIVEVLDDGTIRTVVEGGLMAPGGLTIQGETLYAGDFIALKGYDLATGDEIYRVDDIVGITPLGPVNTVATYGDNLLTSSWFSSAVNVWDPVNNEVLASYADFGLPLNAIPFGDDIIVADLVSASVVRAGGDDLSERSTLTDAIMLPSGLAGNGKDLYAADWATGMIWQLIDENETLESPLLIAEGLMLPEGMLLDGDELIVAETGTSRVLSIALPGGEISVIAEVPGMGLAIQEGYPPTNIFTGITMDLDGNLYVSAEITDVIYRIER